MVESDNPCGQTALAVEPHSASTEAGRPKLLFVGDNRAAVNWGRGASFAMLQTLSSSFDFSGYVAGDQLDLSGEGAGYLRTLLPFRYYGFFRFCWARRWRRPFSWYIRLEKMLGATEVIAENPAVTVDRFLEYKSRHPALAQLYDQAAASDFFLLDGDGDIIFSTPPRRLTLFLLAMIELGIRLRKPVLLVNSMISDCALTGRNSATLADARRLFAQCRAVALRDPESLEYVQREMPEARATFIPILYSHGTPSMRRRSRPLPQTEISSCHGRNSGKIGTNSTLTSPTFALVAVRWRALSRTARPGAMRVWSTAFEALGIV